MDSCVTVGNAAGYKGKLQSGRFCGNCCWVFGSGGRLEHDSFTCVDDICSVSWACETGEIEWEVMDLVEQQLGRLEDAAVNVEFS